MILTLVCSWMLCVGPDRIAVSQDQDPPTVDHTEANRRWLEGLLKRCETELHALDARGCYEWFRKPPRWAHLEGKGAQPNTPIPELATYALTESLRRDPTFASAYLARAGYSQSSEDYSSAIEHAPHWPGARLARAGHYLKGDKPAEAAADFTDAIELLKKVIAREDAPMQQNTREITVQGIRFPQLPRDDLAQAYHGRALARLLRGQEKEALADLDEALAHLARGEEYARRSPHAPSEWILQLAWVSVVNPSDKARDPFRALRLIQRARRLPQPDVTGLLTQMYRYEIITAAAEAEAGDLRKAVELESRVSYGQIPWAAPGMMHMSRLFEYQQGKPYRTKAFWFVGK